MAYALGHGVVVFGLGTLAIAFGSAIPDGLDVWMGRIVGLTLVLLGGWIIFELSRKGRDFRLQSRWMLVINGTFAGLRRVRGSLTGRRISVEHSHEHEHDGAEPAAHVDHDAADVPTTQAHDHAHVGTTSDVEHVAMAGGRFASMRNAFSTSAFHHEHRHQHELSLPDNATSSYGGGTAAGIGMLHGVGIESPTQIAIFVATSSVGGVGFGLTLLGAWVAGLIISNAGLAALAGLGVLNAERSFPVYATVAVIVGILSIMLGSLYLLDLDILPAIT